MKIAVLVGSLQQNSINKNVAKTFEKIVGDKAEFNYVNMQLPLFNQDHESDVPAEVEAARQIVAEADGVLFVTPEYNRSLTGVIKNAIDWLSRPYAQGVILNKKAVIAGASYSPLGTAAAQTELRNIAGYLNLHLQGQPEFYLTATKDTFDENGILADTSQAEAFVEAMLAHFDS